MPPLPRLTSLLCNLCSATEPTLRCGGASGWPPAFETRFLFPEPEGCACSFAEHAHVCVSLCIHAKVCDELYRSIRVVVVAALDASYNLFLDYLMPRRQSKGLSAQCSYPFAAT